MQAGIRGAMRSFDRLIERERGDSRRCGGLIGGGKEQRLDQCARLEPGVEVNMEADLVARYLEGLSRAAAR